MTYTGGVDKYIDATIRPSYLVYQLVDACFVAHIYLACGCFKAAQITRTLYIFAHLGRLLGSLYFEVGAEHNFGTIISQPLGRRSANSTACQGSAPVS